MYWSIQLHSCKSVLINLLTYWPQICLRRIYSTREHTIVVEEGGDPTRMMCQPVAAAPPASITSFIAFRQQHVIRVRHRAENDENSICLARRQCRDAGDALHHTTTAVSEQKWYINTKVDICCVFAECDRIVLSYNQTTGMSRPCRYLWFNWVRGSYVQYNRLLYTMHNTLVVYFFQ